MRLIPLKKFLKFTGPALSRINSVIISARTALLLQASRDMKSIAAGPLRCSTATELSTAGCH